jgi:hypothetical protein
MTRMEELRQEDRELSARIIRDTARLRRVHWEMLMEHNLAQQRRAAVQQVAA